MSDAILKSGALAKRHSNKAWLMPLECFFLSFSMVALLFLVTSAQFENGLYLILRF